jgi:hypothetical protein
VHPSHPDPHHTTLVLRYAERIDNAPELLESFVETFEEEGPEVQLQLLTVSAVLCYAVLCCAVLLLHCTVETFEEEGPVLQLQLLTVTVMFTFALARQQMQKFKNVMHLCVSLLNAGIMRLS